MISAFFAIEISILSNFLFNNAWTFNHVTDRRPFLHRIIIFETISLLAVGIQLFLLYLFTDIFGIYYLISTLLAIPITMSWNFLLNKYVTWKQ